MPVNGDVEPLPMKANWKKFNHPMGGECYKWGKLSVCVGHPAIEGGWHISISHPHRYPTWDEIHAAWYDLVPESAAITGALILPPKSEYVNLHSNCFHVYQLKATELPLASQMAIAREGPPHGQ